MKKIILLFFALFLTNKTFSQEIAGNWNWAYSDKHKSEIKLVKINSTEYKGTYCSSFDEGKKIDCYFEDNEYSIFITKTTTNVFKGTFKSNFSSKSGTLKIEYIPSNEKFKISILTEPDGEYYLPNNVYFEKN